MKISIIGCACLVLFAIQPEAIAQKPSSLRCVVKQISLEPSVEPQAITEFKAGKEHRLKSQILIEVQLDRPGQEMDGVGGAFNEVGWEALSGLTKKKKKEVLHQLFNTKTGAALRFNRIPIGASDFAKSAYSLADSANDWELKHFSIKRDESCLIPYIKAAQAVNPQMKFHASPWSPPGWMKTNGKQTGGGELLADDRTLQSHANYLVKFLQAYQMQGININRLCPQNEPLVAGSYPGCKIPASLYARAVKDFIIPAVKRSGLRVQVWAGTFNYWRADTRNHFDGILSENDMVNKVDGFSFQYTNMKWLKEFTMKYPGKPLQFSESECYNGRNSLEEVLRDFQDFAAYTRMGAKLFTFWNMVLPEPHKSTWGWMQNSLVVIDTSKQTVTYQPSFSLAKMLGSYIGPGVHYIPSTLIRGDTLIGALHYRPKDAVNFMETDLENGEQLVSFVKPNGTVVVFMYNHGNATNATVRLNKQSVEAFLPGKSLIALEIRRSK
jgi:glucosylceramidase